MTLERRKAGDAHVYRQNQLRLRSFDGDVADRHGKKPDRHRHYGRPVPAAMHPESPDRRPAVHPGCLAGGIRKVRCLPIQLDRPQWHRHEESPSPQQLEWKTAPGRGHQLRKHVALGERTGGLETKPDHRGRGAQDQDPQYQRQQGHAPPGRKSRIPPAAHRHSRHEQGHRPIQPVQVS